MHADIQERSKNLKSLFCKCQNCNYLFGYQRKSAFICVQLPFLGFLVSNGGVCYVRLVRRKIASRETSKAAQGMVICVLSSTAGLTSPIMPNSAPAAMIDPQRPGV